MPSTTTSDPSGKMNVSTTLTAQQTTIDSGSASQAALTPNTLANVTNSAVTLLGACYAFEAVGGYSTAKTFATITQRLQTELTKNTDIAGAVQLLFPASKLNELLGAYTATSDTFDVNSIDITASSLLTELNGADKVLAVGSLSSLYTDFSKYVLTYFGMYDAANPGNGATGLATLFGESNTLSTITANNGLFDAAAFLTLINKQASGTGTTNNITGLTGYVRIENVVQLLRNAVATDPFANRTSPAIGVSNGFLADDLIFVPTNGMEIVLEVTIEKNIFPASNSTTTGVNAAEGNDTSATIDANTSTTSTNATVITKTTSVPLLIKLT